MAQVVTAAPMDGAPMLGLHKLDKHFGATHALKVVIGGVELFIFDEPTVALDFGAKAASLFAKDAGVIMSRPTCRGSTISSTPCTSFGQADSSRARDTMTLPRK
jgi:hypothetical protein